MDTKLTLKLNQEIIEKAKKYAAFNNTSLSNLIENYLEKLTLEKADYYKITPLVRSLSGVISPDEEFDEKKLYSKHLEKKYK